MSERRLPPTGPTWLPDLIGEQRTRLDRLALRKPGGDADTATTDYAIATADLGFDAVTPLSALDLPFYALDGVAMRFDFTLRVRTESSVAASPKFFVLLLVDGAQLGRFDFLGANEQSAATDVSDFYIDLFDEGAHTVALQAGRTGSPGSAFTMRGSAGFCCLAVAPFTD